MRVLVGAAIALLIGTAASAATFTDRSAFNAAVAGTQTTETFETASLSGTASSGGLIGRAFGGFSVTTIPASVKVVDTTLFGAQNTTAAGKNYLYLDTDVGFVGLLMTVFFDAPTTAFGFDYSGLGGNGDDSILSVGGSSFVLEKSFSTGPKFFGYTGTTAISSFSINTGNNSAFGVDDVSFASAAPAIPVPATLPLIIAALGSLAWVKRRATA